MQLFAILIEEIWSLFQFLHRVLRAGDPEAPPGIKQSLTVRPTPGRRWVHWSLNTSQSIQKLMWILMCLIDWLSWSIDLLLLSAYWLIDWIAPVEWFWLIYWFATVEC